MVKFLKILLKINALNFIPCEVRIRKHFLFPSVMQCKSNRFEVSLVCRYYSFRNCWLNWRYFILYLSFLSCYFTFFHHSIQCINLHRCKCTPTTVLKFLLCKQSRAGLILSYRNYMSRNPWGTS